MTPKLTDEMRQALEQHPDGPVAIEDERTQRQYVLLPQDEFHRLLDERLRQELQLGFDQADRGESQPWDIEATIQEAHRRHSGRAQ